MHPILQPGPNARFDQIMSNNPGVLIIFPPGPQTENMGTDHQRHHADHQDPSFAGGF
jgi:hypothetical protein